MRGARVFVAVTAIFFLAAPTAGDFGCFTTPVADLDPNKFFLAKQADDCAACTDCGFYHVEVPDGGGQPQTLFDTQACARACGPPMGGTFPDLCYPLVQDGEVCLRALEAASCSDYQSYVADEGATIPTECDFCPPRDAGAD